MATRKTRIRKSTIAAAPPPRSEEYDQALVDFTSALKLLHGGDAAAALEQFRAIEAANPEEPQLSERMRAYSLICAHKLASDPQIPTDAEGFYNVAVVRANDRQLDEALDFLNKALELDAGSPKVMYARASVFALMGQPDSAVSDLRRAVEHEPQLRFQASNDPDFDRVRDEAAFIDVIEPTPAGT